MDYDSSFLYAGRALAVDAYDPGIELSLRAFRPEAEQKLRCERLFRRRRAVREYRPPAYLQLAEMALADSEWSDAAEYGNRCLTGDRSNAGGGKLMAVLYRRRGDTVRAMQMVEEIVGLDPFGHFARCESGPLAPSREMRDAFTDAIRSELPHETYMEIGAYYARLRLWDTQKRPSGWRRNTPW